MARAHWLIIGLMRLGADPFLISEFDGRQEIMQEGQRTVGPKINYEAMRVRLKSVPKKPILVSEEVVMPLAKEAPYYTYADYLEWDENERYEIIDGEAYMMATPSRIHQEISGNFYFTLRSFLEGKPCKVYAAPFSVRLFPEEDGSDDTVVEPDITVVCDPSKLDDRGCNGAPDFIIEIISPSTARYDRIVKFNKYREAGVREYWIVNPEEKIVSAYLLKDGQYMAVNYDDTVPVTALPGCEIDLKAIFGSSEA